MWCVYLLFCFDKTIYCGITNNLEKRIATHNKGKGAKYTKTRLPVILLKSFEVDNKSLALKLEYRIKQLSRKDKIKLIALTRAKELLTNFRKAPKTFSTCREAVLMRVTTILEMANITFDIPNFLKSHLEVKGNMYLNLLESFEDEWAIKVIDAALVIIENENNSIAIWSNLR